MHPNPISLILLLHLLLSCNTTENKNTAPNTPPSPNSIMIPEKLSPLLTSNDFGQTWESVGDDLPEDIQVSFLEERGTEMVLASDNMGVFISKDNKSKWESIGDSLPIKKINALHVSGETIYVGVYRQGVYQTSDEGQTWESLNYDLQNLNVQTMLKVGEQLLVGTDDGIFVLDDSAKSWNETDVKAQVLSIYAYDNMLVAGTSQGTLLSKNKGKQWKWIRKEGTVHYTHHIGKRVVELNLNGDVVYTDDWGENWTQTQYEPRKGSYVYEIIECGDYQLMSNNYGIHRSSDNGKTWEHIFKTETMAFFDLISVGDKIYGGTRLWDEYRKRK